MIILSGRQFSSEPTVFYSTKETYADFKNQVRNTYYFLPASFHLFSNHNLGYVRFVSSDSHYFINEALYNANGWCHKDPESPKSH